MNQNKIIGTAAVLGALSVAIGAFGAHGLEGLVDAGKLTEQDLKTFETGVRYQFYHTFALLAVGLGYHLLNAKMAKLATTLLLAGIIIFSGSLYLLVLSEPLLGTRLSWLGAIYCRLVLFIPGNKKITENGITKKAIQINESLFFIMLICLFAFKFSFGCIEFTTAFFCHFNTNN